MHVLQEWADIRMCTSWVTSAFLGTNDRSTMAAVREYYSWKQFGGGLTWDARDNEHIRTGYRYGPFIVAEYLPTY